MLSNKSSSSSHFPYVRLWMLHNQGRWGGEQVIRYTIGSMNLDKNWLLCNYINTNAGEIMAASENSLQIQFWLLKKMIAWNALCIFILNMRRCYRATQYKYFLTSSFDVSLRNNQSPQSCQRQSAFLKSHTFRATKAICCFWGKHKHTCLLWLPSTHTINRINSLAKA